MQKKQCINFFSTYFKFNIYTNMFYQFCYVTYLYSNVWPGIIGHCDIISAPFIHGVPRCNKPCQWIETVSISSAFWTVIDTYWIAYKFLSWSFFFRKQSFNRHISIHRFLDLFSKGARTELFWCLNNQKKVFYIERVKNPYISQMITGLKKSISSHTTAKFYNQ